MYVLICANILSIWFTHKNARYQSGLLEKNTRGMHENRLMKTVDNITIFRVANIHVAIYVLGWKLLDDDHAINDNMPVLLQSAGTSFYKKYMNSPKHASTYRLTRPFAVSVNSTFHLQTDHLNVTINYNTTNCRSRLCVKLHANFTRKNVVR